MMSRISYFLLLFSFFNTLGVVAEELTEASLFENAHCGVMIKTLGGNDILASHQSDKSFVPASVMKLVTTATALELLSADFRFETELLLSGDISGQTLRGDVVIRGGGDPTLGSGLFCDNPEVFMVRWAHALKAKGIVVVEGSIIADASVFDQQVIPDKWIWEDIGNYYGAGCYGLSCFDNQYQLYFNEVGVDELATVSHCEPDLTNLTFESHVLGADNNRDNAYIYGSPWGGVKQIYGTIPAKRDEFMIKGALPNPPLVLADRFRDILLSEGISVLGKSEVIWEPTVVDLELITTVTSPSLADIVYLTNKKSNNLFAEHMLKRLAVNNVSGARFPDAIDVMMDFWKSKGVSVDGVKVYDGSGLSRATLLTPQFVIDVIDFMKASENWAVFSNSLAISGRDGTFQYFLDDTPLSGKVRGKSGSMSGVRCYAGVYEKSPKESYVFCIMLNNFTMSGSKARAMIENYLLGVFE